MTITLSKRTLVTLLAAALAATVLVAAHEPANKTNVAGAESEVAFVETGDTAELLDETLRVSKPVDLIFAVTAECSILSELETVGTDNASTEGRLTLHVTVDGQHVPVSEADADAGRVVFCDRTYQRETVFAEDEEAKIKDYLATRSANGFNWVLLDAGNWDADGDGLLTVQVWAEYHEANVNTGNSTGAVGNRTLIIEPTHAKNDETLSSD